MYNSYQIACLLKVREGIKGGKKFGTKILKIMLKFVFTYNWRIMKQILLKIKINKFVIKERKMMLPSTKIECLKGKLF